MRQLDTPLQGCLAFQPAPAHVQEAAQGLVTEALSTWVAHLVGTGERQADRLLDCFVWPITVQVILPQSKVDIERFFDREARYSELAAPELVLNALLPVAQ